MKIGFSSLVSPGWDLETIITAASGKGYDGVELRGIQGELHLPLVPELVRDADQVRKRFSDNNVDLVCLGTSASLTSRKAREVARQKTVIVEFIELAAKLGCPCVRIFAGEVERGDYAPVALSRVVKALQSLVPVASRYNVTLLIENGGDFPSSQDLWRLIDAVDHPAVRACWNQCHAMTLRERATTSLPRLGSKIGLMHMCDAAFDGHGVLLDYRPLGQGSVEVAKQIELLGGLLYDGYLIFDWPKLWVDTLPPPEEVLPDAAKFLRDCVDARQSILTAYKGDKKAPKMAPRTALSSQA